MAVYVQPRGLLGEAYMVLIKPFRHWIVYSELLRQIERAWSTRIPPFGRVVAVTEQPDARRTGDARPQEPLIG